MLLSFARVTLRLLALLGQVTWTHDMACGKLGCTREGGGGRAFKPPESGGRGLEKGLIVGWSKEATLSTSEDSALGPQSGLEEILNKNNSPMIHASKG